MPTVDNAAAAGDNPTGHMFASVSTCCCCCGAACRCACTLPTAGRWWSAFRLH